MKKTKENLAEKAVNKQVEIKAKIVAPSKKNTEPISLDFNSVAKERLKSLAKEYKGLVVEDTTDSIKVAKNARMALREPRYAIQKEQKEKKAFINQVKGKIDEAADELISITKPVEDEIHDKITAVEEKKQREKEERDRLERERKENLQQDSISFYTGFRDRVRTCTTVKELNKLAKEIENAEIPAFEEFTNNVSINIGNILSVEIPDKKVQIEEKAELERLRAEQKAKDEELARLRKENEKTFVVEPNEIEVPSPSVKTKEEAIANHDTKFWLEEYMEQIPQFDTGDHGVDDPEYLLLEVVNSKLFQVKEYMKSEIDKMYPND